VKKGTYLLILLSIISLYTSKTIAQEISELNFKKNGIYGSVGYLIFLIDGTINYERLIISSKSSYSKYYAHASYSRYVSRAFSLSRGSFTNFSAKTILGKKKDHLELGLGISFITIINENDEDEFLDGTIESKSIHEEEIEKERLPHVVIGYRYQKPGGNFIFRWGISFPNGIYISMGLAF